MPSENLNFKSTPFIHAATLCNRSRSFFRDVDIQSLATGRDLILDLRILRRDGRFARTIKYGDVVLTDQGTVQTGCILQVVFTIGIGVADGIAPVASGLN